MSTLSDDQLTLLAIQGAISTLPPAEREQCNAMVEHLRRMVADAGDTVGPMAIALIGAELQLKDD